MRQRVGQFCCLCFAWIAVAAHNAGVVPAQVPPVQPKPTAGPQAATGKAPAASSETEHVLPGEVLPKVYFLKDKDGNLQAMPGIGLEQFMEAEKDRIARQKLPPRYSIQKLTLSGSASRERAELTASYTITVLDSGWVGVPLRLNDAVVRGPEFDGPGEHVLAYEPERDGYVVWIRGEAGKSHQVQLKVLSAVVRAGGESRLRLNVPRAAESQLLLRIPVERAEIRVSEGCTLESTRAIDGGKTELAVVGMGGEFDVAWHAAESQVATVPSALEATGTLFVRINGRSVNTEGKLVVRSLGGEFDRFQVRLPPGAQYIGTPPSGMSLAAIDTANPQGSLYEIRLDKKIIGPLELPLVTERHHNSPQADELLELAGFEVIGAVRQSGAITVKVEGDWQVLWGDSNHISQVEVPGDVPRRDDLMAGFEYVAQPYSLTARVVPQRTHRRVQGDYVLSLGSEEAQLSAKLKYTIRGAKIRTLEVELPGWEVDVVGPSNLVNVDAAVPAQSDPLRIRLLQATSGELELTIEAHQKISTDAGALALQLPRPRAEAVAPANVAVVPADNIEIAFEPDRTTDLSPQTARPQMKLPERLQDPLFFRTEGPEATFAASVKVHEQAIFATQSAQLDVDELQTQIDARIAFRIAYEPADHVMLGVPRAIRADRLSITLDGQRLIPAPPREKPGDSSDVVSIRVPLPEPRIGRCELQVRYAVRHDRPQNATQTGLTIPLVIPGEGQVTSNELVVVPASGIEVRYPPGPWSEDPGNLQAAGPPSLVLSARRALAEVRLIMRFKERPSAGATTVSRSWAQTRLTTTTRQDRVVYRFSTSEPRLQLTMPPETDMSALEFEIDARRVTPDSVHQHEVTLSLPVGGGGEHLLEARYRFADRPAPGSLAMVPVLLKSANWVQQFYWQLILPVHEHMIIAPSRYTHEFRWTWPRFFWQREPTWEQRELESWCGAPAAGESVRLAGETPEQYAARQPAAVAATNRYLFSTVGTVEPLEVYTLGRARLVLWASLPLLVCGLVLIYFPMARHPALMLALAVAVAAGSLVAPESALLLAQAASLGLVLAAAAALLVRLSPRAVPQAIPVRGSSKAIIERGTTEIYHRERSDGSQPSTATDPLMSTTSPEVES